jgi:short-subunit dehydrogenase involved in D-alanine esterification of teichoic acids
VVSSRRRDNVQSAIQKLVDSGRFFCIATTKLQEILGVQADWVAGCVCHVGNPEHRRKLVEFVMKHYKRIDILFHNAGVNPAMGGSCIV